MLKRVSSFLVMVMLVVLVAGCGGSSSSANDLTMDSFVKAFLDSGEDITNGPNMDKGINKEDKPFYQMIGAEDGVIFNLDTSSVKVYEYKSEKELKSAQKQFGDLMEKWSFKGKYALESTNEKAIEIFNSVK